MYNSRWGSISAKRSSNLSIMWNCEIPKEAQYKNMAFSHFIGLDVKFFNYCFVLWTKIYIGWTLLFNTTIFIWVMSGLHFLTYDKIFNWKNICLYNWMYFVWSMPINFEPYSKKADLLTHLLHFVGNWTVQCVRRHWYHSNLDNSKLRNPI